MFGCRVESNPRTPAVADDHRPRLARRHGSRDDVRCVIDVLLRDIAIGLSVAPQVERDDMRIGRKTGDQSGPRSEVECEAVNQHERRSSARPGPDGEPRLAPDKAVNELPPRSARASATTKLLRPRHAARMHADTGQLKRLVAGIATAAHVAAACPSFVRATRNDAGDSRDGAQIAKDDHTTCIGGSDVRRAPRIRLIEGVLSIGKLACGQEEYYLSAVADGVDEYYTAARGEAPGRWLGGGSRNLGLDGIVAPEDLRAVLSGRDPHSTELIGRRNRRVPGFDCTFSAPKSASLLYALGSREIVEAVTAAHDLAVDRALGYLERHAAFVRRGHDGVERIESEGFVAAAFRHRTSRAGDPQLHTHVLVANAARGTDGRWGALDARLLYLHRMAAGFLYQAQLRAELCRRLGVRWRPVRKGLAEMDGIPERVLRAFSQRRVEIEARLGELGLFGVRAAEIATLDTRRAKPGDIDPGDLRSEWRQRAAMLGFDRRQLAAVVHRGHEPAPPRLTRVGLGEHLTEHRSHFDRRHVLEAIADAAPEGADVSAIEDRADRYLASAAIVRLSDGPAGPRYSTPELLAVERNAIEISSRHRNDGVATVPPDVVQSVLAARPTLTDEQKAMVRHLTTSGAAVDVVVGAAGSGKTFALEAARAAWHAQRTPVIGVALAARAAAELEAGSGIPSFTLASTLNLIDSGHRLPRGCVVAVDEAAMVGTRQLATLLRHARAAKAKVVLVGDHRQLPEIEAGGLFAHLARELDAVHLIRNQRQRDPLERRTADALRAGQIGEAVLALQTNDRITHADNPEVLRDAMVDRWWEARQQGSEVAMIALGRAEVDALNAAARRRLDAAEQLGHERLRVGHREFAVGDDVIALRNRRRLGVTNGTRGTITAIDTRTLSVTVATFDQRTVVLPAAYMAEGHLDHGYATTLHKAQGRTVDIALTWGDERLYQEAGYTALTRGRDENRLYVLASEPDDEGHTPRARRDPVRELATALRRSAAQELAQDIALHR